MSFVDPGQQQASAPLPAADDLFPEEKPDAAELFPEQAPDRSNEPQRRAAGILGPLKAAVAPGPVGDWIFGNTQHSSLARIMHAFGSTVSEDVANSLPMSDETRETLKGAGLFNDYVAGQHSLLKANAETLARSGAVLVNGAIYGMPAVFHGLESATLEAGEQAAETAVGRAIGVKRLTRDIAELPHAFPTFEHPNLPRPPSRTFGTEVPNVPAEAPAGGISIRTRGQFTPQVPLPEPLAAARELDVIGPGGEAAWKGVGDQESTGPVPIEPEIVQEAVPDWVRQNRAAAVKAADDLGLTAQVVAMAKEGKTAREISEALGGKLSTDDIRAVRDSQGIAASGPLMTPGGAMFPSEAPTEPRPEFEAQRANIAADVERQLVAAGRPPEEAEAAAQIAAARYVARAERMNGALGTPEELYRKEGADIRGEQIRQKIRSPGAARALDDFQERMAAHKDEAKKRRDEGKVSAGKVVSTEEKFAGQAEASTPQAVWDSFSARRQERNESRPIETAYNAETTKGGSAVRGKATQVWEAGNTVDVGFVKNLLVAEKRADGSFTLLAKPDKEGMSQSYNAKPQQGLVREEKVNFLDKTRKMREPTPEETWRAAQEDAIEAQEPHEREEIRQQFSLMKPADWAYLDEKAKSGEFFQGELGKIRLKGEGQKPVITLMKRANASTFIHESGHQWLEEMMRDAAHEAAPADLKADAKTVRDWLGSKEGERIKERHHEKFARGFEQYVREGIAPSRALANVFAKFKAWLTRIYQTVQKLGSPITDDIRGVFDRMLENTPQRTEIIRDEAAAPFHERHEELAETTAAHESRGVANTIQAERDSVAAVNLVEESHARLADVEPGTGGRAEGAAQPANHGAAPGPERGEARPDPQVGAVVPGGGEAAAEGAGAREGESPVAAPNAPFDTPATDLIDKAGNIRLDKLNQPDDIDAVIRQAARNNNDFLEERRGVLSDGQTLDLADALGMDPAWLDRKKIGEAFNVEEIRAARRLLVQSAENVRDAMIEAKGGDEAALQKMAEAIARHEMIQGKVSQATAEAGRALRAFREKLPGQEEAMDLNAWLKANTGRTLFQLQEMARYGADLKSPAQVSKFVHDTAAGRIKQQIIFYYVNALISGPITHARYFAGNALTALWAPLVKTPIAAGIDFAAYHAGLQAERRTFLGEAGAELYAFGKGSREGWKAAGEGWRTGNTPHLPGEAAPELFPSQPVAPPISGKLGTVIGLPGKAVGAIHGFGSAVRYEQEIAKLSYRRAMQEKLSGADFTNRVADLGNRPTPEMMEAASKVARSDLYMAPTEYDSLAGKLTRAANHNVFTKLIVPFMKIGTQITRNALIEATPLGAFDKKVRANLSGANGPEARSAQAASIVAGTGLMGTMAMMTAEGLATGDGPSDPGKRAVWLLSHHPNSIQIGDISIRYKGLGSLGVLMSLAANAYETHRGWGDDEGHSIALDYLHGFEKAVLDENFLRGVKDMIDAIYHYEEYGDRYIANMVTNWIPYSVGLGQVARQIDPYQRETKSSHLADMIFKEAQAKIPWVSEGLYPRRDMFGEPIPSAGPVQNYENDPVVKAMDDLHFKVGRLPRKIRGVELSDAQYDDFARVAGRKAKMHLDDFYRTVGRHLLVTGLPEDRAKFVDQAHKLITQARESTGKEIMMHATGSENDIMKQATEAKKIKKGLMAPPAH